MRILLCICGLSAAFAQGAAYAQSDGQSSEASVAAARATLPNSSEKPEQQQARGRAWFARCMQDWDPGTHMTKKEWEGTCHRLAQERTKFVTKFLMEQRKITKAEKQPKVETQCVCLLTGAE
jgi:hypothetical protein